MSKLDDIEGIILTLKTLIAEADDATLREIATYDHHGGGGVTYGEACELHYRGLKDLIYNHDLCVDWNRDNWYPMESIELRSFVPQSGTAMSFGVAIAILLVNDLREGGRDFMEDRSGAKTMQAIRNLPNKLSDPILTGLAALPASEG